MLITVVSTMLLFVCGLQAALSDVDCIPPRLASRESPLSLAVAAESAGRIKSGLSLDTNLASFCKRAGFLCNESTPDISSVQLFALTTYDPPKETGHARYDRDADNEDTWIKMIGLKDGLFFGRHTLSAGSRVRLWRPWEPVPARAFLPPPLQAVLSPLLSRDKLPQVMHLFGFAGDSTMANSMQQTLELCESPPRENEIKACVSSLEEMLGFGVSVLGTNDLEILMGEDDHPGNGNGGVNVNVTIDTLIEVASPIAVACHNVMFPYQVFYCHCLQGSRVFKADLIPHDMAGHLPQRHIIHTSATCHDFSHLLLHLHLPKHWFELVCHWNFGDNIVLVPKQALARG